MKLFSVAQMVQAEQSADNHGHPYATMMEIAGCGVADAILARGGVQGCNILVLVGTGNNGGDGLVAARYLAKAGATVTVYLYKPRNCTNFQRLLDTTAHIVQREQDKTLNHLHQLTTNCHILIDALLGTGVTRPIRGALANVLRQVDTSSTVQHDSPQRVQLAQLQSSQRPERLLVAVDCPSGLHCDTGELDPLALSADLTVTFAGPKHGHFIFPGAAACGEIEVIDIGIDPQFTKHIPIDVATAATMRAILPKRPLDGHKGTFGSVMIAGGSADYLGAPILSAHGALRAGSGLVALAIPQALRTLAATRLPEATYPRLPDVDYLGESSAERLQPTLAKYKALLLGPGLGQQSDTFLAHLLATPTLPKLVLDADALNYLSRQPNGWEQLPPNSILTPHPGEMARLVGQDIRGQNRVQLAQRYAAKWQQIVVLKGAYTVVADPSGAATVIPIATPLLAVAGSGDVLAGVIVGLVGQGMVAFDAAVLGAYLHASAGRLLSADLGDAGLLAHQIADSVPFVRQTLSC